MNDSTKGQQKLASSVVKAKTETSSKPAAIATTAVKKASKPKTAVKPKQAVKKESSSTQQDRFQKVARIWPD